MAPRKTDRYCSRVKLSLYQSRANFAHFFRPLTGYNTSMTNQPFFRATRGAPVLMIFMQLAGLAILTSCQWKRPSNRETVAEVDGQPIFRDQVERVYRSRQGAGSDTHSQEEALSFKLNVLDELINNQILVGHASHADITVSEAEVDNKVAELQSPYSAEEFEKRLRDQGLEMDEFP